MKKITKKSLEEKCQEIIEKNLWKELSQEDQDFVINEVLKYHPEWDWYTNQGIWSIKPEMNDDMYKTKCFYIYFPDGTKSSISYKKSLKNRKLFDI